MLREPTAGERARLQASQRLLHSVVADARAPASIHEAQETGFDGAGLDPRDARHLALVDARHLDVYRKLVRGTLLDTARLELPLCAARLGDRFAGWVHRFCEDELPRSPILRDAAYELARWATPLWQADQGVPPYLADLARYELMDFDVHCARRLDDSAERGDLDPARPLRFDGSVRLGRFGWRVHRVRAEDDAEPAAEPVTLLAYRDAANQVHLMELTQLCGAIVERLWLDRTPLGQAVSDACQARGQSVDQRVIDGTAEVLADLARRGALHGPGETPRDSPWMEWLFDPSRRSGPRPSDRSSGAARQAGGPS